jgi:membrane protein DedA with SNARE-associated domain
LPAPSPITDFIGDSASYLIGYWGRERIKHSHIYLHTRPRLERLSARFGIFAVFLVKYIYGLRTASAIFWGFAPMGYRRFGPLTLLSCLAWVVVLLGGGFFFSGAIEVLIGEVERVGLLLLTAFLIACAVALILYLTERYVIARQVPEMEPLSLQEMYDEVKSEEKAVEGKGGGDK